MAPSSRGPLRDRREGVDTQEHDTGDRLRLSEYQVAEIFVFRQQQPIFVARKIHDPRVSHIRCEIGHVANVVPRLTQ